MKAGTNMKVAGKTVYVFVLLAVTMAMRTAVPPRLSLYCDEQGSPVCEAAAGKPPAQLSWVPESSSTAEEKYHNNGTVTVLSKFTACDTNVTNVTTCMVSHPAGNWSQTIACCPSEKVSVTVGDSSVLTCPLKGQIYFLTWKITPKAGGTCTLVYRSDTNTTHRETCSDNINWTFRAGLAPALEIRQVGIAQEGNYSCEAASTEGNFHITYHLTVLEKIGFFLPCVISLVGLMSLLFSLAAFQLYTFFNRTMSNWCKPRQLPPAEVSGLEQR